MTTLALTALFSMSPAHAQEASQPPPSGALGGSSGIPWASDDVRRDGAMRPWGQLQTWVTVVDQDTSPQADPASYGDPETDPGFTIARGRFGFDGYLPMGDLTWAQVDYGLSVGIASPYDALSEADSDVRIVDAFGRFAIQTPMGPAALSLGAQRVVLSRESMMSSADLLFQERGLASAWLVPGRETGAILGQSLAFGDGANAPEILARVGAYNGNGSFFGDDDPGVMTSARLEFSAGDAYRTWSSTGENALGIGVGLLDNPKLATSTHAIAADVLGRFKIVTLTGELVRSTIVPTDTSVKGPAVLTDTTRLGLTGQLSVWVGLHDESGLEIGSRYSSLDDSLDREDAGDVWLLHNGITWRNPVPFVDVGAGYIHRTEVHGAAVNNDTVRIWTQIRPRAQR
jgi:hypothetical protein